MSQPDLLILDHEHDYQIHFEQHYCRARIFTFDGIRVYFSPRNFNHAFYESTQRNGIKDLFSRTRAERMNWIKATLEHSQAELYQGWDNKSRSYVQNRRVCVVYEAFVVVLGLSTNRQDVVKANFMTCYQADNSIDKIRRSPKWRA